MAEKSKNSQQGSAATPPPSRLKPAAAPPGSRRVAARKRQEEQRQRLVIIITGATIGLALLTVLIGLAYEQLWLPSRPVARVGASELTRSGYWTERKQAYAREIVQNFQLLALFGGNPQFTQQFLGQSPVIDQQIAGIRSAPLDEAVVEAWIDRQVKIQGAAAEEVVVSEDEVNQALASDLGLIFLPPPTEPLTTTTEPALATTTVAVPTAAPTATVEVTPTPGGPTATPAPTSTPRPTPAPAEAASQVDQIVDEIFRRYEFELAAASTQPQLARNDFRAALQEQYREQLISTRVQEQLVPADGFNYSDEPERVGARQILVAVNLPENASEAESSAAFAAARASADAIAAELRGGVDFATLAAERSDDPGSRESGGDLGSFDRDGRADNGATYPPELVAAAFTLPERTISDPIRTRFGWHVIEVTRRDVPSEERQLREARTAAFDSWVAARRAASEVRRFPEPTPSPTAVPTEPVPTPEPTFLPGPPTPVPTPTLAPTEAATATP